MDSNKNPNAKEQAEAVLRALPDDATADSIAYAIWNAGRFQSNMEMEGILAESRNEPPPTESIWSLMKGCLIPVIGIASVFLLMPLLFGLGDKLFSKTARPVRTGIIEKLTLDSGPDHTGFECFVHEGWIVVKRGGEILIPASRVESLQFR
jgi:hypothetical protein